MSTIHMKTRAFEARGLKLKTYPSRADLAAHEDPGRDGSSHKPRSS
jgi:hypothetical protein